MHSANNISKFTDAIYSRITNGRVFTEKLFSTHMIQKLFFLHLFTDLFCKDVSSFSMIN